MFVLLSFTWFRLRGTNALPILYQHLMKIIFLYKKEEKEKRKKFFLSKFGELLLKPNLDVFSVKPNCFPFVNFNRQANKAMLARNHTSWSQLHVMVGFVV